jgi:hypothetical protein
MLDDIFTNQKIGADDKAINLGCSNRSRAFKQISDLIKKQ